MLKVSCKSALGNVFSCTQSPRWGSGLLLIYLQPANKSMQWWRNEWVLSTYCCYRKTLAEIPHMPQPSGTESILLKLFLSITPGSHCCGWNLALSELCQNLSSCSGDAAALLHKQGSAITAAAGLRKTLTSFTKQIIWGVKRVPAHCWDISQSLHPPVAVPFLGQSIACAGSMQKELHFSLWHLLCVLPSHAYL